MGGHLPIMLWSSVSLLPKFLPSACLTNSNSAYALASEVATLPLRAVTQSLVTACNAFWGWVYVFTIPYMLNPDAGNLGGKIGFVFGATAMIAVFAGYFLFPETKGLTTSELDYLYAEKVSVRHFPKALRDRRAGGELAHQAEVTQPAEKNVGVVYAEDIS